MSLPIEENRVVSIHYTLTDGEGNVLDSSEGAEPLAYLHGRGNIIPGLENSLVGKSVGDVLNVKVEPSEGYGEVNPDMIQVLEKEVFQGVDEIEVGMSFDAEGPDGARYNLVVTKVEGDDITVDANHPLAGVELNFDVQIVDVREATSEELAHGHAH